MSFNQNPILHSDCEYNTINLENIVAPYLNNVMDFTQNIYSLMLSGNIIKQHITINNSGITNINVTAINSNGCDTTTTSLDINAIATPNITIPCHHYTMQNSVYDKVINSCDNNADVSFEVDGPSTNLTYNWIIDGLPPITNTQLHRI